MDKYAERMSGALRDEVLDLLNGRSQAWLARETGIYTSTLSRYLSSGRTITIEAAGQMAGAFGLTLNELIARAEKRLEDV